MAEEKVFKIIVARPALVRYQESVLPYLFEHFTYERAIEIDENILATAATLERNPARGRKEKYLEELKEEFRFILHKETRHLEIKIIYFISENIVYITDFFPTRMDPRKITPRK
jgi:hypothetical protein